QGGLAGPVLADDGDDGARGQGEGDVLEREARGAGIGEGDVLEADAVVQRLGRLELAGGGLPAGVVLEPGQPARAVGPEAAQEADLAHGGANVAGEAGAGRQ